MFRIKKTIAYYLQKSTKIADNQWFSTFRAFSNLLPPQLEKKRSITERGTYGLWWNTYSFFSISGPAHKLTNFSCGELAPPKSNKITPYITRWSRSVKARTTRNTTICCRFYSSFSCDFMVENYSKCHYWVDLLGIIYRVIKPWSFDPGSKDHGLITR